MNLKKNKLRFLEKLFIWSLVTEPMMYFMFTDVNVTGFGTSLSRLLQLLVLIGFPLRLMIFRNNLLFPNPLNNLYSSIWMYFGFMIFSTILGLTFFNSYDFQINISRLVFRPFIEVFILIYTILYFIFFTVYFLKEKEAIDYFFKIFHRLFLLSFVIGLLDVGAWYLFNYDLVGIQLLNYRNVGVRFHGFFGEPRDAFGALILWIAMFYLREYWRANKKTNKNVIFFIFFTSLLTLSLSAFLSIIFSIILVIIFAFKYFSNRQKIQLLCILFITVFFLFFAVSKVDRFNQYMNFNKIYSELSKNKQITGSIRLQRVDIIPIWERWTEAREFNIIPIITGTGIASSAFTNMEHKLSFNYGPINDYDIEMPRSNLVRIFYDTGIIGLVLFIYIFLSVLKKGNVNSKNIIIMTLFVLGCFLGHRSYFPFIFLGVLIAVINQKKLLSSIQIESNN